ncbi:MAG: hypothetical protein EZS28_003201 [Streblomastix strix]|uniref:Uncharacterized protein n=1 Tax=Streblomastix strix TaxID=222440 RepID=A0A5J4X2K8_9EUKA|nr:MAG: hypothetical protein EZS28_003201 [Streblomastix strix]
MGDYAYSAQDLLVWIYQVSWIETDQIVPDQVTPASDNTPSVDSGAGVAGIQTDYARGDHQLSLQVSSVFPSKDTINGEDGVANTFARSDHTHHVNLSSDIPLKDTGTGTAGTSSVYASTKHQHPLNVDPSSVNVPLVNATVATGGTSNDILLADGSTKQSSIAGRSFTEIDPGQYVKLSTGINSAWILYFNDGVDRYGELCVSAFQGNITDILTTDGQEALPEDYSIRISRNPTNSWSNIQFGADPYSIDGYIDNQWLIGSTGNNTVNPLGFTIVKAGQEGSSSGLQINQYGNVLNFYGKVNLGNIQINLKAVGYDDGLRISRADPTSTGNSSIQLGCSRTSTVGAIDGQWSIFTSPSSSTNNPQSFVIVVSSQAGDNNRGLQISAD